MARARRVAAVIPSLLGVVALLAWAEPTRAADGSPSKEAQNPEELRREIQRLQDAQRALQSDLDALRGAIPPATSGVVTVPAGAHQGTDFKVQDPSFGPSQWVPTWPPVGNSSPQGRGVPPGIGTIPPPLENPLDFPQFVPGMALVQHGLGAREVSVAIGILNPDGSVNSHVDSNRLTITVPSPPDGTFTIVNYYDVPVTIRWSVRGYPAQP